MQITYNFYVFVDVRVHVGGHGALSSSDGVESVCAEADIRRPRFNGYVGSGFDFVFHVPPHTFVLERFYSKNQ